MKPILVAIALAILAGCASVASQGGTAPEQNFSYPRSPNFA
jgi:hypothetical protein